MGYTLFTSEFTDLKDEDWKVKIYTTNSGSDTNIPFSLGPDGFRLSYDFDEYDRCKPIVGSRVQFTMYQNDSYTAISNAFYILLGSETEGEWRVEIYKDPDSANTLFWAGELLAEQTIIPDEYPSAAVQLTAVDGLANLKGIKYNSSGSAYTGTATILGHLHNIIQKLHVSDIWTASDVELKFYEDFIGKEYKDDIAGAQNKQLENAKISHDAFYNKDSEGIKQYYSAYEVLETLALTFNVCVFCSEGSVWWLPLGAIQDHANTLDTANYMLGDGSVTYNTVANVTTGATFGSASTQYEKLKGWERTSTPQFKEVKRTREYGGVKPVVKDSLYNKTEIEASTILDDEDIEYPAGRKFLVSGMLRYEYPGDNTSTDGDKIARLKLGIRIRVGDAGGDDRYLLRATTFNANNFSYANFFDSATDTDENDFFYYNSEQIDAAWSASPSYYEIISPTLFNKRLGTENNQSGVLFVGFQFLTPEITAATGLQLSATLAGVDKTGGADTDLVDGTSDFSITNFQANIYDEATAQEFNSYDITATNPDDSRYKFNQGTTLIGDRISDSDLGTILINNGSSYVDSTEWTSLLSSTSSLSINGLGVRERLAANLTGKRIERGTLYKVGSTWIHPYTILSYLDDSGNYYQITGLNYVANSCEYDIQCMYLSRSITGITVVQDNSKGPNVNGFPEVLPDTKGPGADNIVSDNSTKLGFITTDTHGITKVTTSTGGAGIDISLPISKATTGHEIIAINAGGAMSPVADGSSGEFLKTDGSGVLSWAAATASGSDGFFGSKTLLKVMPSEFIMNDDYTRAPVVVEDDVTNILGIKAPSSATELYAFIVIPSGMKATHVQVYASATTSSAVDVRTFNQTTGGSVSQTTGDLGSNIDITDITSTDTRNMVIKLSPASAATVIYGADVTIAAT
jgi:hypothetical protein